MPLLLLRHVYVPGRRAWREFDVVGRENAMGKRARLGIIKRIVRCAATNVDPDTGIRDLAIPDTLMRRFEHADCGIYGRSEEHTSELQSHSDLVCRLLLEKKKRRLVSHINIKARCG